MSIEERVTRLEVQSEQNTELLSVIDTKLTALSDQFLKHKGFIGGVIFTVTAVWTAFLVALDLLWKK